jgi:hypothetical protein
MRIGVTVFRSVASLRDATNQCWLVGPLRRADLAAILNVFRTMISLAGSQRLGSTGAEFYPQSQALARDVCILLLAMQEPISRP